MSKPNIERELKYGLDKESFKKMMLCLKRMGLAMGKPVRQENYYFDTPELALRKKKLCLRLRIENGRKALVTVKKPSQTPKEFRSRAYKAREENEVVIPIHVAKQILLGQLYIAELTTINPIQVLLKEMGSIEVLSIQSLGRFVTQRSSVNFWGQFTLEMDAATMFKQEFFEFEIETSKPELVDKKVRALTELFDIAYAPLETSKLARFIALWKKYQ